MDLIAVLHGFLVRRAAREPCQSVALPSARDPVLRVSAMAVSFMQLLETFELMGMANPLGECEAILCKQTGKIYYRSDSPEFAEFGDELPDDIDDGEKYIVLPDKRELDLGKALVLDFAREFLPDDFDEVRYIFSKRGAYQKFKALLVRRGALEKWYDFEAKVTERALRDWCEVNSIAVTD
jgi:hypothetical protein